MGDGRTPTFSISGTGGSIDFEDAHCTMPFAAVEEQREYQERKLRLGSTGKRRTVRVFEEWSGSELSIAVTIRYMTQDQYNKLRAMHRANPPEVTVSYLHLASVNFDMVYLKPVPDDFDWLNQKTYIGEFRLLGQST